MNTHATTNATVTATAIATVPNTPAPGTDLFAWREAMLAQRQAEWLAARTKPAVAATTTITLPKKNDPTIRAFEKFHADNPRVYEKLRELALQWKSRGKTKCSIALLINVVRWELSLDTTSDDVFLINNNFASFYARLLMAQEPELRGIFETRKSDAAESWIQARGAVA